MKKYLIVFLVVLLCACSSGGSSQTSSTTVNNDNLIDPVDAGNGVWNYSVATDYFYGIQQESPSLWYDLKVQYQTNVIQFVFAQFPTLDLPISGVLNTESSSFSLNCPTGKKPVDEMFNYYALPQLTDNVVPNASTYLGPCANGESVTTYYSTFISHPVPLVDVTQAFNAALAAAPQSMVIGIADQVASVINNDPNTYGIAFDNEPAINKQGTDKAPTAKGYALEATFYGEIALQLAKHKKYLFLFDADYTGINLYESGLTLNGTTYKLNNIILSQYLYDLDTTNPDQPAGPVSLGTYTTLVTKQAKNDLSPANESQPPLRFVLPASSTSTMWDYAQGYDMVSAGSLNPANATYHNQTTLTVSSACESYDATTPGTIDHAVLGLFLCDANGNCPENAMNNPNIINFIASANCVRYANPTPLHDYFSVALVAVESAVLESPGVGNQRYLGADLYTWNIDAFSEINGAKGYYNLYQESSLYKQTTQIFPPNITPVIWQTFLAWDMNLFK